MRIISGKFKSRKLVSPKNEKVRPTTDRARETVFNILNSKISFEDLTCIDLFCGTGSFGIECISRGAAKTVFVDRDVKPVIQNINSLGIAGSCEIIRDDVLNYVRRNKDLKADLIFCDPPYKFNRYGELIGNISSSGAIVIIEHEKNTEMDFNENIILKKKIGITNFTIYDFSS
jgi:16S rRNA (guanine966-N2)-methyltransferase